MLRVHLIHRNGGNHGGFHQRRVRLFLRQRLHVKRARVRRRLVNLLFFRRDTRGGRHRAVAVAVHHVSFNLQIEGDGLAHQVNVHQRGFANPGAVGGVGKDDAADQHEVRPDEGEVIFRNPGAPPRRDRDELGKQVVADVHVPRVRGDLRGDPHGQVVSRRECRCAGNRLRRVPVFAKRAVPRIKHLHLQVRVFPLVRRLPRPGRLDRVELRD